MTELNDLFKNTFDRIEPISDDKSFIENIIERKDKMNNDGFERRELHEITVPHVEQKPRKAPWIAAIAGFTAAAAGLGFFAGTRFDSGSEIELSPFSHPEYTQNAAAGTEDTQDFDYIFQSFSNQSSLKTFDFDGFSVNIMKYEFDGKTFNLYYNVLYADDFELSRDERGMCLAIDHFSGIAGHGLDNIVSQTDNEDDHVMSWKLLIQDGKCTSYDLSFIPCNSEYTEEEYARLREKNKFTITPNAENVISALPLVDNMDAVITTAVQVTDVQDVYVPEFNGLACGTYANDEIMIDVTSFTYDYKTMEISAVPHEGSEFEKGYTLALMYKDGAGVDHSVDMKPDEATITAAVSIPSYETRNLKLVYMPENSTPTEDMTVAYFIVKGAGLMTENAEVTTATTVTYPIAAEYTAVEMDVPEEDTTGGEDWHNIAQGGSFDGYNYDFSDVSINVREWEFDGRIFKCDFAITSGYDPNAHTQFFSADPKTLDGNSIHGGGMNEDGTFTLVTLLPELPDGQEETIVLRYMNTKDGERTLEDGPEFTITGDRSSILKDRVGQDLTDIGLSNTKLEWITLSPFGLQLDLTSDTDILSEIYLDKLGIEITYLVGTKTDWQGFSLANSSVKDFETGKYNINILCVPADGIDLMNAKEISVFGRSYKKAELMPISYWDGLPES